VKILAYQSTTSLYPPPYTHIASPISLAGVLSDDPDAVLHWLVFSHTTVHSTVLGAVWSLAKFYAQIPFPDSVRSELSSPPHRSKQDGYRLFYIPDKILSLNKNGSEVSFYDLGQYFPDDDEPKTLAGLQAKADELQHVLADIGAGATTTLSSPVAIAGVTGLLDQYDDTAPTIFDAPASHLEAYEMALQCTPREWVSNFQVGCWDGEDDEDD